MFGCNGLNVKPNYEKGFIKYFGSSEEKSLAGQVQVASDGGYLLIGTSSNDMYIAKTDASGNKLWEKKYGGSGADSGRAIRLMADGSLMAMGTYFNTKFNVSGIYFMKLTANGDSIWSRVYYNKGTLRSSYGADFVYDEQLNRFCLVGGILSERQPFYIGAFRVLVEANGDLTKLQGNSNSSGNQQEEYISGINTFASCIIKDQNDYYFTGTSGNAINPSGVFLVQMNKTLNISNTMFQSTLQADNSIVASQMLKFENGSYIFVGTGINKDKLSPYILQFSNIAFPSSPSNAKTTYLASGKAGTGRSVVALKDGSGFVVVGSVINTNTNGNQESNIYITKVTNDGTLVWEKNYGGIENDEGMYVKQTPDNGFIIIATLKLLQSKEVIALIKVDENGELKN